MGYVFASMDDIRNDKCWFGNRKGRVAIAMVTSEPVVKAHVYRAEVSVLGTFDSGKLSIATGKTLIYIYKDKYPLQLHLGDTIFLPGTWEPIMNAGNPFEFDYAKFCGHNNLYYRQYLLRDQIRVYSKAKKGGLPIFERAHAWCMTQFDKSISDSTTCNLLKAMLLGDESGLDEQIKQSWSDTGVVHIIAISGGNIMMFFAGISVLMFWIRNNKYAWLKYLIALPIVWFYVMISGGSPSAVRAVLMFTFLSASVFLQKEKNTLNQLFATAFVLLCFYPNWLFSVGYQLSFLAVLSIVLFHKYVYSWYNPKNKLKIFLWSIIAASISAEVLVAPLVVYYFHNFPVFFLVANAAGVLFMGLVQYIGMGIIGFYWLPSLAQLLGKIVTGFVCIFNNIILVLQSFSPTSFKELHLTVQELVIMYIAIWGICSIIIYQQKRSLFLGLGALCLLLTMFCMEEWQSLQRQVFVSYNIGNKDHFELINGKNAIFIGSDKDASSVIDYAVKQTHINWSVNNIQNDSKSQLLKIANKSILILKEEIYTDKPFHTDNLIVDYKGNIDPLNFKNIFTPSLLIIGNVYSKKEQRAWKRECKKVNQKVHCLGIDGSYELGNN